MSNGVAVKKDEAGNEFVDGGEIPTEYENKELAASLDAKSFEDIEARASEKFGADFKVIQDWVDSLDYLRAKTAGTVTEQHDVIAGLAIIAPFFPVSTVGLRGEFALFQVYACKKLKVKVQGIQPWENYFYTEQEAEKARAAKK
jgi:hypothetical protein